MGNAHARAKRKGVRAKGETARTRTFWQAFMTCEARRLCAREAGDEKIINRDPSAEALATVKRPDGSKCTAGSAVPKGTNSIAGGDATGHDSQNTQSTLKGSDYEFHAFSVKTNVWLHNPWALPTAIESHAFGVTRGSGSDTHKLGATIRA